MVAAAGKREGEGTAGETGSGDSEADTPECSHNTVGSGFIFFSHIFITNPHFNPSRRSVRADNAALLARVDELKGLVSHYDEFQGAMKTLSQDQKSQLHALAEKVSAGR